MKELLTNYGNQNCEFFELRPGETKNIKVWNAKHYPTIIKGTKIEDNIRYTIEYEGKKLYWDRNSKQLARELSQYNPGEFIEIRREGEKNKTVYFTERTVE